MITLCTYGICKDTIGIERNMKKVLCSAEKSSVIWAEPHSRSSAEQFCQTERLFGHYFAVIRGNSNEKMKFVSCFMKQCELA